MGERQAALSEVVAGLVRQAAEVFYQRIAAVYAPLVAYCEDRVTTLEPLLGRVMALDQTFDGIAARL